MFTKKVIKTRSRFRVWYLTTFTGRQVQTIYREPVADFLGITFYNRSYLLAPMGKN